MFISEACENTQMKGYVHFSHNFGRIVTHGGINYNFYVKFFLADWNFCLDNGLVDYEIFTDR